jgi:hypothetical protein
MGWWSTDILGGDTPLDFKSEFYSKLKLDQFKDKGDKVKTSFEKYQKKFVSDGEMDNILNEWGCGEPDESFYRDYKSIGYQVLAVILMENGCQISYDLKDIMLNWIPTDNWASEDDERKTTIQNLVKTLTAYDGSVPFKIKSKGLFEVWAEKIQNKNI